MSTQKENHSDDNTDIPILVRQWVNDNSPQFGHEDEGFYRPSHFERCKRYLNAPTGYLETRLNTLPEAIKWYFQIMQIIIFTGLWAIILSVINTAIENFYLSIPIILEGDRNWGIFLRWLLPLAVLPPIFFFRKKVVRFIQLSFLIKQNLNEADIEMYYISTILDHREMKNAMDSSVKR